MKPTEWRPVPDFEDRYEVSELGEVRTSKTGHIHKQFPDSFGHLRLGLWKDGKIHTVKVHRAVARAFLGEPAEGHEVCHNDGNPKNNALSNLRWGTRAENVADRIKHGRTYRGGSPRVIPESDWASIVERRRSGESCQKIAATLGVSGSAVERLIHRLAPDAIHAKAFCINGHRWTEENIFMIKPGVRRCRPCEQACSRRKYLKRKAKRGAMELADEQHDKAS